MKHSRVSTFLILAALCAQTAQADELRLRGGIASGFNSDYTYALGFEDTERFTTDYGLGGNGSISYRMDNVYAGFGLELGLQFGVLSGSDDTGGALESDCQTETFLGLISDCHDRVDVENLTSFAEIDALASYGIGGGQTTLLGGVSALGFRNQLEADHLFPGGFESFVDRDTEFTGFGLKVGARHVVPLQNGMSINIEGLVGRYRGERSMDITDDRFFDDTQIELAEESFDDTIDVTTFELTPSLSMPANWAGDGATMEFGISYKLFQGIVDSRNVVAHGGSDFEVIGAIDAFEVGEIDDDVSSTSIFAGLTIPLN